MLTKAQKISQIKEGKELLKGSDSLIFADFEGTKAEDLRVLRNVLREAGAKYQVIKKRLLGIVLKENGINFDTNQFDSQVGTIFVKGEISGGAQPAYKFSKQNPKFKILGGLTLEQKEFIPKETIIAIGNLPSREVLLGQLLGVLSSPLRAFMYVLSEKSKRS